MNSIIDSLDEQTKIQLLYNVVGFNSMPVDIDTFIHDEYYLGNTCGIDEETGAERTRMIWQEQLHEVFPNPISCSSFIANTGAIGCVLGNTEVLINDKAISIKKIYKEKHRYLNSRVKSFDLDLNESKDGHLGMVWYTGKKKVITLTLRINDSYTKKVTTTLDHKFLNVSKNYIEARDLNIGSYLLGSDGSKIEVIKKSKRLLKRKVYDLTIPSYHNYGISLDNNIYVYTHNTGKSFDAKIIIWYQIYKLICAKDPYSWNGLYEKDKPFIVFIGHTEKYRAQSELDNLMAFAEASPFFQEQFNDTDSFIHKIEFIPGSDPGAFIGKNLIISWI